MVIGRKETHAIISPVSSSIPASYFPILIHFVGLTTNNTKMGWRPWNKFSHRLKTKKRNEIRICKKSYNGCDSGVCVHSSQTIVTFFQKCKYNLIYNLEHSDCAGRTSQCIRKSFPTAKLRLGYRTANNRDGRK